MSAMTVEEIKEYLPHRYPFLLLDRVVEWEKDKRIVAVKNVTVNEPFFQGHFPGKPVFPGVLMLEALAQTCGLLGFHTMGGTPDPHTLFYFVAIDGCRFRDPVEPGDQVIQIGRAHV